MTFSTRMRHTQLSHFFYLFTRLLIIFKRPFNDHRIVRHFVSSFLSLGHFFSFPSSVYVAILSYYLSRLRLNANTWHVKDIAIFVHVIMNPIDLTCYSFLPISAGSMLQLKLREQGVILNPIIVVSGIQ